MQRNMPNLGKEHARLEVETYENRVELLRSVHKEQGEVWDWLAVAASLPPPRPQKNSYHEQRAIQRFAVVPSEKKEAAQSMPEKARLQDEQDYQTGMLTYKEQMAEWERLKRHGGQNPAEVSTRRTPSPWLSLIRLLKFPILAHQSILRFTVPS